MQSSYPILTYWYYHVPNFILAAVMYTMLGRAFMALLVQSESKNYIWRAFCQITDPFLKIISPLTPKAVAPVVLWMFGFVWLFWLRVALLYGFLILGLVPPST